jgi:hypothetical protein
VKRANKPSDFGPANGSFPSFGLEIYQIKAKPILFYDTVNAFVSCTTNCFPCIDS